MKNTKIAASLLFSAGLIFALTPSAPAQPANAEETLRQYVADLQQAPTNAALRRKIIQSAQEMNPPPAIPEEAKRHMARGIAASEGAKTDEDFKDASKEFGLVIRFAPWLGNGYRNHAIALDKAGKYDSALNNLSWYLATKPSPADVEWADEQKAKIEYRKEKAAKESTAQAQKNAEEERREVQIAAQKAEEERAVLKFLPGTWEVRFIGRTGRPSMNIFTLRLNGRTLEGRCEQVQDVKINGMGSPFYDWKSLGTVNGRTLTFPDGRKCEIQIEKRSFVQPKEAGGLSDSDNTWTKLRD